MRPPTSWACTTHARCTAPRTRPPTPRRSPSRSSTRRHRPRHDASHGDRSTAGRCRSPRTIAVAAHGAARRSSACSRSSPATSTPRRSSMHWFEHWTESSIGLPLGEADHAEIRATPTFAVGQRAHLGLSPGRALGIRRSAWSICQAVFERRRAIAFRPLVGPHAAQPAGPRRLHVPRQQVLPRLPLREGHRARHRPPDRAGGVLDQPERDRRHRQRRRPRRRKTGDWRLPQRRPARRRRRGQRHRATSPPKAATRCSRSSPARSTSTARCCSAPPRSARIVLVLVNV